MNPTLDASTDRLHELQRLLRREDPSAQVRGGASEDTVDVSSTLPPTRVADIIASVFASAVDGCCSSEESADGCCGCCGN